MKKMLSFLIISMILIVSNISVFATDDFETGYRDVKVTISSEDYITITLIQASYENERISHVKVYDEVNFIDRYVFDIKAKEGDKLFVWDSVNDMTPLGDIMNITFTNDVRPTPAVDPTIAPDTSIISGECGDNAAWILDTETGVLSIGGSGAINDYISDTTVPWANYTEKIKSVIIEDGITCIGKSNFYNCVNLTDVSIADSVTEIDNDAFAKCTSLTEIAIPDTVTRIGWYSFENCTSLKNVSLGKGLTLIPFYAFSGCNSLENVSISEGVKYIASFAFENCTGLTEITFPESVITIDEHIFMGCNDLKTINVSKSLLDYYTEADAISLLTGTSNITRVIWY